MDQKKKKVKKRAGKVIHSMVAQHAIDKAKEIRARYGPVIDYPTVLRILEDRRCIRYPLKVQFVTEGIEPGMFGKTEPVSEDLDEGYVVSLHQAFEDRPDVLPALILYQSVLANYGDLATADDAEIFGSSVLDMEREAFYAQIVDLTDTLWAE
jgi:hypothetical protein